MQYRPTAAELLDAVARLLGDEVLEAVPEHLRHRVRVAENLCRILQREAEQAAAADRREAELLAGLLGRHGPLAELQAEAARRLRRSDDPAFDEAAWRVLVEVARSDLAVAKPGHDAWEGA